MWGCLSEERTLELVSPLLDLDRTATEREVEEWMVQLVRQRCDKTADDDAAAPDPDGSVTST